MNLTEILADVPVTQVVTRETADEAAERLGIEPSDAVALRRSLGAHFSEIQSVETNETGVVAVVNGIPRVFRGESHPDGNGNTGWLFLSRPDGRDPADPKSPAYLTPVFAAPAKKPVKKAAAKGTRDA